MRIIRPCLYALFFVCSTSFAQQQPGTAPSTDLSGSWDVQIMDKHHQRVATMTVSFTNQDAFSCMVGLWKQVAVSNYHTKKADFFPGNQPLSYSLRGNDLTFGEMTTCDAYQLLSGTVAGSHIEGTYSIVGISGGDILGYFKASRN